MAGDEGLITHRNVERLWSQRYASGILTGDWEKPKSRLANMAASASSPQFSDISDGRLQNAIPLAVV
jgi:hypothetical protein